MRPGKSGELRYGTAMYGRAGNTVEEQKQHNTTQHSTRGTEPEGRRTVLWEKGVLRCASGPNETQLSVLLHVDLLYTRELAPAFPFSPGFIYFSFTKSTLFCRISSSRRIHIGTTLRRAQIGNHSVNRAP